MLLLFTAPKEQFCLPKLILNAVILGKTS